MSIVNIFGIAMNVVMDYSLLVSNSVAFYSNLNMLNEIQKIKLHFALKVSFNI